MTISTNRFDRIALRNKRLEKRSERLESRIDTLEDRLEDLDPITDYDKIQRIENRIDKVNDRIATISSKLPQDEFEIIHRGDGMFDIEVTDSPYDDTYIGGTSLKFSVSGVRPNDKGGTQRQTGSIMIHSFDNKEGSTFVGSSSFESIAENYNEVFATLYGEDNQVLESITM